MRWPWVSRDVVAAKDEMIAHLLEEIRLLRANPAPVNVHLDIPEGLIVAQPAVMRRVRRPDSEQPEPPKIDLANLDENDPNQIAALVMREVGPQPNKYLLRQAIRNVRVQIMAAKEAKRRPQPPPPEEVKPAEMPDEIRRMIQEADSGNAAAVADAIAKKAV